PIGLAGGLNPYGYVHNPVSFIDPLGLCKALGESTGEYSAINPGPLSNDLAATFSGGRYKEIVLSQDTELYRAGVNGRPFGQFFSLDKPQSVLQTRIDKAVLPNWPGGGTSPLDSVFKLKVPAGTKIYVGDVGYQNGIYIGGTQQIVIPKSWDTPGVQVLGQGPLL
ncbi:RHS repeat-associated core domain-containing protein, partial [Yersinia pseudotuberculosis]